ncbi:MAG: dihydrodipicolinate synthase family protein [Phycisphaerae bacterium]|nr:dihydrodipicolinate synthase family protein [Phycisphaerae bacterium]
MNTQQKSVGGVVVPVITPIDKNENVDEKAYRAIIRHCLNAGVDGVFAGGSAGMGPLLCEDQWIRAMEIAHDEVPKEKILLGGAIATSTKRAIKQIKILETIGFDHVAVTPTFYITISTVDEMMSHFGKCRDATDMEMIVYNIPGCTNSSIPLEAMEKMAANGWMKAIKESSGDKKYFSDLMKIASEYSLNVMQGNEPDIEWGLNLGAAGIVPVCANYEPATFVAAVRAAANGEKQKLIEIQKRANSIRDALLMGDKNWIAGIMYGLKSIGIGSGIAVVPLQELKPEDKKLIDSIKPQSHGSVSQIVSLSPDGHSAAKKKSVNK